MKYPRLLTGIQLLTVLLLLTTLGCSKQSSVDHTAGMNGTRKWHGYRHLIRTDKISPTSFSHTDTIYSYTDTAFAIQCIEGNRICVQNQYFTYQGTDTVLGVRYFGEYTNYLVGQTGNGLAYYYTNDSMVWVNYTFFRDVPGEDTTVYHTYK